MIAAILHVDGVEVERSLVERMLGVWRPVAPDAEGNWAEGEVGLGEARLWLSEKRRLDSLPARDAQRALVLAWDGRLDNHEDLMALLGSVRAAGAITDEGLVLDAYTRWGISCVERLLGDFAFVLWDGRARRLFAARDHIGIRPLHYAFDGRSLVVASRISQVIEGAQIERRLNEPVVADFLSDNRENPKETLFRDVWRVPAAHVLQYDLGAREPRLWRYWELQERAAITYRTDGEYVEHFRDVAETAVKSRLRGPHPVGIMQSGGYDSATVACLASKLINGSQSTNGRLATFTTVFDDRPGEDERRYVEALAAHCDFEAHYVASDEMWTFKDSAPRADSWDEPFEGPFDGLIAGALDCAQRAGVRVLLDGLGGDMLFAGNHYHLFDLLLGRQWGKLLRELKYWPLSLWPGLIRSYMLVPLVRRCPPRDSRSVPEWISADFVARCETEHRLRAADRPRRFRRPAQQMTYEEITRATLPTSLLWMQSQALAYGIDLRHPVLDVRLIDFFMRIPSSQKVEGCHIKSFIGRAMKDSLPQIVLDQSLKVGKYLEPSLNRGLLERWDAYLGGRSHVAELGYVDPVSLEAAFAQYIDQERDYTHARALALVLRLEQWLRHQFGEPD